MTCEKKKSNNWSEEQSRKPLSQEIGSTLGGRHCRSESMKMSRHHFSKKVTETNNHLLEVTGFYGLRFLLSTT